MMAVVSVSLFFLYFLCLWSLQLGVASAEKLLCLLYKTILKVSYLIIILWISLEKGECFDFNHSLGCVYPTLYIIRLLHRVCHFSFLICYPSSLVTQIVGEERKHLQKIDKLNSHQTNSGCKVRDTLKDYFKDFM